MCNPLMLIAGGLKVGGSLLSGFRTSAAEKFQAEIARINADIAAKEGLKRENTLRTQVDRVIANQTASFAARGLDPTFGSPLALAAFTQGQGETDARLIRADTQAAIASSLGQAAAAEQRASDARLAGWFGAGTALLGTAQEAWPGLQGQSWWKRTPTVTGLPTWGGPR